jgi:sugar-specific transcriptional regulator TrmB
VKRLSKEVATDGLMGIGLTETEARVYIVLLEGASDAKRLSQAARVPYSKIHTLLRRLEEKGLASKKRGRPTLYEGAKPREALEKYQKRLAEDLARRVAQAEQALQAVVKVGETEKPDIWIIRGQEEILRKAYETLNGAKEGVKLALPAVPELALAAFLPIMTRLRADKVSLKLLLSRGVGDEVLGRLRELAEIRLRDRMFGGGLIVDDREALLVIGSEGADLSLAIWSSHSGLVDLAKAYFDYLWHPQK